MLNKLSEEMRNSAIRNIKYREAYVTGKVTVVNTNGSYDVEINNCGKSQKNIFPNDPNIIYVVGNTVGIGYEEGNRGMLIIIGILREIVAIEVSSSVNSLGV